MTELIVIAGAPGSGKSTLSEQLKADLGSVAIDFGHLRDPHLDPLWSNTSESEHEMAFENLIFTLNNYFKHGYQNVMVEDLLDRRNGDLCRIFAERSVRIFTLVLSADERRARIEARAAGWTDVDRAIVWDGAIRRRPLYPNETLIDTSGRSVSSIADEVLELLKTR